VTISAVAAQVGALRSSAGLARFDHVAIVRIDGPGAFALVDALSPSPLFLREGQMRHTLLLDEDARPAADLYVCSDEEDLILLAEGLSVADLLARIEGRRVERVPAAEVRVRALDQSHVLFGVHGPYAWEVAAALVGPTVLGMPYLSLMRVGEILCLRSGKTGEFGYDFLVTRDSAADVERRLLDVGAPFDLTPVTLPALDLCALENWHFNIRTLRDTPLARPLTPIELQLQWRVNYSRDFVGADALRARRAAGAAVRATFFTSLAPVAPGAIVSFEREPCGEVLAAAASPTLGVWVGTALITTRLAHPGLELSVAAESGAVAARTATPPLVRNRSLFVDPHRHSYRTRDADVFPPLVLT
jgi:glycine cleavage system aminomethyltransferase T